MEKGVKIQRCPHKWTEIENASTQNFCKYCKVHVPDLSNKSISQVIEEMPNYTCARFHERHLSENKSKYFFINRFESKLENLGFVKVAAVLVFTYLFIVGCGNRHRTAGAYADYKQEIKEKKVNIQPSNHKNLLSE